MVRDAALLRAWHMPLGWRLQKEMAILQLDGHQTTRGPGISGRNVSPTPRYDRLHAWRLCGNWRHLHPSPRSTVDVEGDNSAIEMHVGGTLAWSNIMWSRLENAKFLGI